MGTPRPGQEPTEVDLGLPHGEVHVWRIALERGAPEVEQLAGTLSDDERERAARLREDGERTRFIVARGALRAVLGRYTGSAPERVPVRYGAHGKPRLDAPGRLEFNLSHAGEIALLACARDLRVGIDVERVRPLSHMARVARRVMTGEELAAWLALPEGDRLTAFFDHWTRMEALAKLAGTGVWRLLAGECDAGPEVRFHRLAFDPPTLAVLAVEGEARVTERELTLLD